MFFYLKLELLLTKSRIIIYSNLKLNTVNSIIIKNFNVNN